MSAQTLLIMIIQKRYFGLLLVRLAADIRAPGLELIHAHFRYIVQPIIFVPADQLAHAFHAFLVSLLQREVVLLVGFIAILRVRPLG